MMVRTITDKNDIEKYFNTFFRNIGIDLASKIAPPLKDVSTHDYLENRNITSMFLRNPVNEKFILSIIRTCNNKISTDSNGVSMNIGKKTLDTISKPQKKINMSFESGVSSPARQYQKSFLYLKIADFNNYIPISLLCQFTKILEKLHNKRLEEVFIANKSVKQPIGHGKTKWIMSTQICLEYQEYCTGQVIP